MTGPSANVESRTRRETEGTGHGALASERLHDGQPARRAQPRGDAKLDGSEERGRRKNEQDERSERETDDEERRSELDRMRSLA